MPFVKTGKVDERGTPYVIQVSDKLLTYFPEDADINWVSL